MKLNAINDPQWPLKIDELTAIEYMKQKKFEKHYKDIIIDPYMSMVEKKDKTSDDVLTHINGLPTHFIEERTKRVRESLLQLKNVISLTTSQWRLFNEALRSIEDLTGLDLDS